MSSETGSTSVDSPATNVQTAPDPSSRAITPVRRARHLMEAVVFLALAVVLIRAFQVEGYLITTGSMATSLQGAHERLACPHCQFPLVVGLRFDDSSPDPFHQKLDTNREEFTTCPNCGEPRIPLVGPTISQGDQILIHKGGFLFRDPQRFEPALFRNPDQPHEIYIKRVVGLPGETVLLKGGDLFIDNERIVKTLDEQRQLRELIHDENYSSNGATDTDSRFEVRPRWHPARGPANGWARDRKTNGWNFVPNTNDSTGKFSWIQYQHWLAAGGRHRTTAALPEEEQEVDLPPLPDDQAPPAEGEIEKQDLNFPFRLPPGGCPVQLNDDENELSIYGVLTQDWYNQLAELNRFDPEHLAALAELKARSHLAPITDYNYYNPQSLRAEAAIVRDLMLSFRLRTSAPGGQVALRIDEGSHAFDIVLDFASQEVTLFPKESQTPILTRPIPDGDFASGRLIEFSTFDRHLLLAIDDEIIIERWALPFTAADQSYPRTPVEVGAQGGTFVIDDLCLYRDLYYRSDFPEQVRHAVIEPYQIGADEYFVLGDNSMSSWDSRCWAKPVVPRIFLLGRPLIVHLPSQSMPEQLGGHHFNLRVPDLDRVRWIH